MQFSGGVKVNVGSSKFDSGYHYYTNHIFSYIKFETILKVQT